MDSIQKVLIKMGRKDLAQEYYQKIQKKAFHIPTFESKDSGAGILEVILNEPRFKPAVDQIIKCVERWEAESRDSWEDNLDTWNELGVKDIGEATKAAVNDVTNHIYNELKKALI